MLVTVLILLFGLLALAIPVAASLGLLGLALDGIYSSFPLHRALGEIAWSSSIEPTMIAIPLFVLLGQLMLRSGMAADMYEATRAWLGWLPGGVMHANIGTCALFAATSGSSVATAATITTVSLPEIKKHGYNEPLFLGTLAAGGTLGILIPPSINMIIYAVLTNTSVTQLYLSALLPGLLLAGVFSLIVVLACVFWPQLDGTRERATWRTRVLSLPSLLPPLILFVCIIGSIYAGIATPSESAALGVLVAALFCFWRRRLNYALIRATLLSTMDTTAMIMLIVLGASFLNFVLSGIGLTAQVSLFLNQTGLGPVETMLLIIVFYIVLGCVMESLSIMIATTPIIAPIVIGLGYDPVWFGILLMVLIEVALITPPVGMNLYVVQGVRRRGEIADVIIGSLPFVGAMLVFVALLMVFPEIALLGVK